MPSPTDTDTTATFTQGAVQTIHRMNHHRAQLAAVYGESSVEHQRAAVSLAHALATVIGLGGRVSQDDDLGLFGASYISYGVVFHAGPVPDAYADVEGAPVPGEWTVHS